MLIGFKKKAAPHMLTKACAKNASPFQQSCPGASNCEIKIQESGLWYSHSFCTTTTLTCLQSIAYPNVISFGIWATQLAPRTWKPWNPETPSPRFPNHQAAHGSAPRPRSFGSWKLSVSLTSSCGDGATKSPRKVGPALLFLLPFCCSAVFI